MERMKDDSVVGHERSSRKHHRGRRQEAAAAAGAAAAAAVPAVADVVDGEPSSAASSRHWLPPTEADGDSSPHRTRKGGRVQRSHGKTTTAATSTSSNAPATHHRSHRRSKGRSELPSSPLATSAAVFTASPSAAEASARLQRRYTDQGPEVVDADADEQDEEDDELRPLPRSSTAPAAVIAAAAAASASSPRSSHRAHHGDSGSKSGSRSRKHKSSADMAAAAVAARAPAEAWRRAYIEEQDGGYGSRSDSRRSGESHGRRHRRRSEHLYPTNSESRRSSKTSLSVTDGDAAARAPRRRGLQAVEVEEESGDDDGVDDVDSDMSFSKMDEAEHRMPDEIDEPNDEEENKEDEEEEQKRDDSKSARRRRRREQIIYEEETEYTGGYHVIPGDSRIRSRVSSPRHGSRESSRRDAHRRSSVDDAKPHRSSRSRSSKNYHDGTQVSPEKPSLRRSATTAGSSVQSASSVSRRSSTFLGNFFGPAMIRPHAHAGEKPKTYSCVACLEDVLASKSAKLKCDHRMCNGCLKRSFQLSINDPQLMPPRCCTPDHIPLKHVTNLLDSDFKKTWNRKYAEFSAKNRLYCPSKKCGEWIKPELVQKDATGRKYAKCSHCKTKVCGICNGKWHSGADCPKDEETNRILEQAKEEGWKRCYKCRAMVELKEGCNHMTCRCGAEFCMICGSKWKQCDCPWFNQDSIEPDHLEDMMIMPTAVRGDQTVQPSLAGDFRSSIAGQPFSAQLPVRPRQQSYDDGTHVGNDPEHGNGESTRQLQDDLDGSRGGCGGGLEKRRHNTPDIPKDYNYKPHGGPTKATPPATGGKDPGSTAANIGDDAALDDASNSRRHRGPGFMTLNDGRDAPRDGGSVTLDDDRDRDGYIPLHDEPEDDGFPSADEGDDGPEDGPMTLTRVPPGHITLSRRNTDGELVPVSRPQEAQDGDHHHHHRASTHHDRRHHHGGDGDRRRSRHKHKTVVPPEAPQPPSAAARFEAEHLGESPRHRRGSTHRRRESYPEEPDFADLRGSPAGTGMAYDRSHRHHYPRAPQPPPMRIPSFDRQHSAPSMLFDQHVPPSPGGPWDREQAGPPSPSFERQSPYCEWQTPPSMGGARMPTGPGPTRVRRTSSLERRLADRFSEHRGQQQPAQPPPTTSGPMPIPIPIPMHSHPYSQSHSRPYAPAPPPAVGMMGAMPIPVPQPQQPIPPLGTPPHHHHHHHHHRAFQSQPHPSVLGGSPISPRVAHLSSQVPSSPAKSSRPGTAGSGVPTGLNGGVRQHTIESELYAHASALHQQRQHEHQRESQMRESPGRDARGQHAGYHDYESAVADPYDSQPMAAAAGGSTLSSRRRRDSDRDHERERDRDVDRNPYRSAVRRNRLYQQQQEQLASQARGGNPFYAGNSIIDDDIGYHHRDESPPRAKDSVLAGLNGSGHGMDRVYEWRVHVEPGVPEGDVTGAMGPIRITS